MGKLQSKLALKHRQRPEGGSPASSVLTRQGELERIHIHKGKLTENLYVELKENKFSHNCNLKVVMPPKKTPDKDKDNRFQLNKQTKDKKRNAGDTQCDMVLEEDLRQEWVFKLYNFDNCGKVTKEDMSILIQSMYDILRESVKPPCGDNTHLKIKLAVSPSASPDRSFQTGKKQSVSEEVGSPIRKRYCEDENIERRKHYLDLAGIENYSSKFDNTEPPCQEPTHQVHSALQHCSVVARESCTFPESPRGHYILHSLKSKHMPLGKNRSRGEARSCRLHGHLCQSHSVRTHSKRVRSRISDAPASCRHPGSQVQPGEDTEILHNHQASCGTPLAQRHEHHHHHEHKHHHHHHHHHHHYHPT
ncbi:protein naked cuticle homolog 2-like isoform X1 [Echeneis naucrates]|uniref:Protein naked cuticle homolog n=1 Tax=Echeneis naucrates TaxID=173247 RepID=A0A665TQG4_ECHNA|nr:protein naked cuticle homolog 2-like isoform X1 [Echeneis naucrates]